MKDLKSYLNKFIESGFLKEEDIGLDQVEILICNAHKNLNAAKKNLSIDEETCYSMAYNAMLKTARAIIYLNGFRLSGGRQHKTSVDVSGAILGEDFKVLVRKFDQMRRKRNQFTYDPKYPLSEQETKNALKTAKSFILMVDKYFEKVNPQMKLF